LAQSWTKSGWTKGPAQRRSDGGGGLARRQICATVFHKNETLFSEPRSSYFHTSGGHLRRGLRHDAGSGRVGKFRPAHDYEIICARGIAGRPDGRWVRVATIEFHSSYKV